MTSIILISKIKISLSHNLIKVRNSCLSATPVKYLFSSKVEYFNLSNNWVPDHNNCFSDHNILVEIADIVSNTGVRDFNIGKNNIQGETAIRMVSAFKNSQIEKLNLEGGDGFSLTGLKEFFKGIDQTKVKDLELSFQSIFSSPEIDFDDLFRSSKLTSLSMSACYILGPVAIKIVKSFKGLFLKKIDMRHNHIDDAHALLLAPLLQEAGIEHVNLQGNPCLNDDDSNKLSDETKKINRRFSSNQLDFLGNLPIINQHN